MPAFPPVLEKPVAPSEPQKVLSRDLRDELTDLRGELDTLLQRARPDVDGFASSLKALETRLEHACVVAHGPDVDSKTADRDSLRMCLESFADAFTNQSGIPCHVLVDGSDPAQTRSGLDEEQREALRGILTEALSNVERHAHADSAAIQISAGVDGLRITVSDDGWGLCPAAARASGTGGLARMRADASAVGGHLEIETPETGGTRVSVCLPPMAVAP